MLRVLATCTAVACVGLMVAGSAAEKRPVTSADQACEVLKRAAVEFHLSTRDLTGRYYCDPLPGTPAYYVLGLRYSVKADELVGSDLIGWFAIAKSDGTVLDWDITEERATPLAARPPSKER